MKRAIGRRAHARAGGIILALVLILPVAVSAQTTRPTTATSVAPTTAVSTAASTPGAITGKFEQIPLRHSEGASNTSASSSDAQAVRGIEPKRVALAIAVVLALIFVLRWVGQRFFPAAAANRSSSAVRVLSRSIVSPKQQFLLLQVGRRIVVVGDCGVSMNRLAEITDPEEVASLIGQLDSEKPGSLSHAFGNLFGSARKEFNEDENEPVHESTEVDEPELELAGAGAVSDATDRDPEVSTARGELRGLMDKVKMLSRQFHK